MGVDVSKAAVDARVAKRDGRKLTDAERAAQRIIGFGFLGGVIGLAVTRMAAGSWPPALLAIVIFGLAFAAGQAVGRATGKRKPPQS
jgi:hypothetical protein